MINGISQGNSYLSFWQFPIIQTIRSDWHGKHCSPFPGSYYRGQLYVDLCKAFDATPHKILAFNSARPGFGEWSSQWVRNWLDGCTQKELHSTLSQPANVLFPKLVLFTVSTWSPTLLPSCMCNTIPLRDQYMCHGLQTKSSSTPSRKWVCNKLCWVSPHSLLQH